MSDIRKPSPPRWAERVLRWRCPQDQLEEVQGDLQELFEAWVVEVGSVKARRLYGLNVLGFLRPLPWRKTVPELKSRTYYQPKTDSPSNSFPMLANYVKIAWRNLVRHKAYSAINMVGLATGMAVAMLIGLWVWDELSFNKYHQNYNSIAQVTKWSIHHGKIVGGGKSSLAYPLVNELKTNYRHQFKHIVTAWWMNEYILSVGEKKLSQTGQFIEAGAPEMLTLKMLKGTWAGLEDPHSIMLSASTAKALFGDADPMNQLLKINNQMSVKVTGVYQDLPHNTEFHEVRFFAPWDLYVSENAWIKKQDWKNHFIYIYAQIQPNTDFKQVSANIKDAEMNQIKHLDNMKELVAEEPQISLFPMSDWHLYGDFKGDVADSGPVQFVWLVGIIGGFVLLLACINFMNLSTARSEKRAKEVGIRKAIGSRRRQLIHQFLGESLLMVLLAFGLALFLVEVSLPWFNDLADKQMTMLWANPFFWLASIGFMLLTGLLAGSYPALYLSSFNPVKVLKGTFRVGRLATIPRQVLVVLQFTVSVTLIICTIIVYNQLVFAKNRPVGYTRDGLLMVQKKSEDFYNKHDLLRNELIKTGVVAEMAESGGQVTNIWSGNGGFEWKGKDPQIEEQFGTLTVTPEYGKTVGWQFVAGRDFFRTLASDSAGLVINEAAVKFMGLLHPVGEVIRWKNENWRMDKDFQIIGVVKDMVMESPFEPMEPTVFLLQGWQGWINIKINPHVSASEALPKIQAVFNKLIPSAPFDYQFADEEYAKKFAAEERIGQLAAFFASLAIFISCLGLFGLACFVAEQRTKEIGIRKVLGATVYNLWRLLSKDFVRLVTLSLLIAIPTAHYFMHLWLQKYPYRTELSWWIFASAALGALVITLVTVSFQAIKAALANPVKSLRTE